MLIHSNIIIYFTRVDTRIIFTLTKLTRLGSRFGEWISYIATFMGRHKNGIGNMAKCLNVHRTIDKSLDLWSSLVKCANMTIDPGFLSRADAS